MQGVRREEMDINVLLQRQMELHGTLRRPPHTPAQLQETHETLKELSSFFEVVRRTAQTLRVQPETVFQCLMQIGLGSVVSFDRQRRDGEVPMHQAKVLARASALELEPRLRDVLPVETLSEMVELSKSTRTLMRIKVEDLNDFNITEKALQQAVEYLDFIKAASSGSPDMMFKFYMVEDEASLVAMLGCSGSSASRGLSESAGKCSVAGADGEPIDRYLPDEAHIEQEVRRLALVCGATSEGAGERLIALRTLENWLSAMPDDYFNRNIRKVISHLSGPLSVCAGEKRSAICRQACAIIVIVAERASTSLFSEGPLVVAAGKWCSVLLRGVFVTVSAIAHASDTAVRALAIGSGGHTAVVKSAVEGLVGGTHPELRRKCLGYIALCTVVSRGGKCRKAGNNSAEVAAHSPDDLTRLAEQYMSKGDTSCRRMARALYIVLKHFNGSSIAVSDKKIELLVQQEYAELKPLLDNVKAFESSLFGSSTQQRNSVTSTTTVVPSLNAVCTRSARSSMSVSAPNSGGSPQTTAHQNEEAEGETLAIHDTTDVILVSNGQLESSQTGPSEDDETQNYNRSSLASTATPGLRQARHQPSPLALKFKTTESRETNSVKFTPSLQRKIDSFCARSAS